MTTSLLKPAALLLLPLLAWVVAGQDELAAAASAANEVCFICVLSFLSALFDGNKCTADAFAEAPRSHSPSASCTIAAATAQQIILSVEASTVQKRSCVAIGGRQRSWCHHALNSTCRDCHWCARCMAAAAHLDRTYCFKLA